jgi:enoyl-CoA hydratase
MPIRTVRDGRIVVVTIDRPPVNALSFDAYDEVAATFRELSADPDLSVAVLTGAGGKAFCAGHDVKEFVTLTPASAHAQLPRVCAAFDAVQQCELAVIAAVNGPAIGAGLALAGLADIRLASSNATFALPEIDVGVLGSASHLMRLVPQGTARLMALTGRRLSAAQALRAGLVDEVHPPDELIAAAMALAEEIATKSPPAVRLCKVTMNQLEYLTASDGYVLECEGTEQLRQGRNAAEGARAVLAKRDPAYDMSLKG